ncbi:unnamed protein product [Amoebophrya sp. A25]|nr:unnamed protein product [Amoebophrya sp. A25]|eukprot:GSA25T00015282001.1
MEVGGSSPSSSSTRQPRRVRNLLAAYYSMDDAPASGNATPNGGLGLNDGPLGAARANALNDHRSVNTGANVTGSLSIQQQEFDSHKFSAETWFKTLLANEEYSSIPRLVRLSNNLDTEIKTLDSELQTHVYENYSKFIRATDVIHEMSTVIRDRLVPKDIVALEASLQKVDQKVNGNIATKLLPGSEKIAKLLVRQQKLEKVRGLVRVPAVLRECLEKREYGRAAEVYCKSIVAIRQRPETFKHALVEIDKVMHELKGALEKRLQDHRAEEALSTKEAVHSSQTLLELGSDRDQTASIFLTGRGIALDSCLDACVRESSDKHDEHALQRVTTLLVEKYAALLRQIVEGYLLLSAQTAERQETLRAFVLKRLQRVSETVVRFVSETAASPSAVRSCLQDLGRSFAFLATEDTDNVRRQTFGSLVSNAALLSAAKTFESVQDTMVSQLKELHVALQAPGLSHADALTKIGSAEHAMLLQGCLCLTDCQPLADLVSEHAAPSDKLLQSLVKNVQDFFLAYLETCKLVCKDKGERAASDVAALMPKNVLAIRALAWSPKFALALVRIGRHLETRGVAKLWSVGSDLCGGEFAEDGGEKMLQALSSNCRQVAAETLARVVEAEGARLAHTLRHYIYQMDWDAAPKDEGSSPEPSGPQPTIRQLVARLKVFEDEVATILGDPKKNTGDPARSLRGMYNTQGRGGGGRSFVGLLPDAGEVDVESMLARSTQIYGAVLFNRAAVMSGVVKIVLRGFSEYVRQIPVLRDLTAARALFVDVHFLVAEVLLFVPAEDQSLVEAMGRELTVSALGRCPAGTNFDKILPDPQGFDKMLRVQE